MEDQYIRRHVFEVFSEASEAIDKAADEYSNPDLTVDSAFEDSEFEAGTQESVTPEEAATGEFKNEAPGGLGDELDYTRQTAVQVDSVDDEDTAGHEHADQISKTREFIEKVDQLNEEMREIGSNRRFVHTKSDAPADAYVYSVKGVDYYYKIDDEMRPSDVTELNKDDSWWLYDKDERVLKTILALAEEYPETVEEVEEVEQAYTFTDRALKTEDEVVRDEDVFTLKQQDAIVAVLVQARDFE